MEPPEKERIRVVRALFFQEGGKLQPSIWRRSGERREEEGGAPRARNFRPLDGPCPSRHPLWTSGCPHLLESGREATRASPGGGKWFAWRIVRTVARLEFRKNRSSPWQNAPPRRACPIQRHPNHGEHPLNALRGVFDRLSRASQEPPPNASYTQKHSRLTGARNSGRTFTQVLSRRPKPGCGTTDLGGK